LRVDWAEDFVKKQKRRSMESKTLAWIVRGMIILTVVIINLIFSVGSNSGDWCLRSA
jgi:hypothetical protein